MNVSYRPNFTNIKFPVIILSSIRTGSTVLGHEIVKSNNEVDYFNEPLHFENLYKLNDFKHSLFNKSNFLLKIHAWDLVKPRIKHETLPDIYKCLDKIKELLINGATPIRIRRRSIVDQVASAYMAKQNNTWHYTNDNIIPNLEIHHFEIAETIKFVKHQNKVLNDLTYRFAYDLFYEDLDFSTDKIIKVPKPKNYDKLLELVGTLIKKYD